MLYQKGSTTTNFTERTKTADGGALEAQNAFPAHLFVDSAFGSYLFDDPDFFEHDFRVGRHDGFAGPRFVGFACGLAMPAGRSGRARRFFVVFHRDGFTRFARAATDTVGGVAGFAAAGTARVGGDFARRR